MAAYLLAAVEVERSGGERVVADDVERGRRGSSSRGRQLAADEMEHIRINADEELARSSGEWVGADASSEADKEYWRRLPWGRLLAAGEVELCEAEGGDGDVRRRS